MDMTWAIFVLCTGHCAHLAVMLFDSWLRTGPGNDPVSGLSPISISSQDQSQPLECISGPNPALALSWPAQWPNCTEKRKAQVFPCCISNKMGLNKCNMVIEMLIGNAS